MARIIQRILIGFAVIAGLLVVAGLAIAFATPLPKPNPLPSPNGYDEFVKAATLVCDETGDYHTMNEDKLRGTVSKNVEALRVARAALGHESRVPLMNWATNSDAHLQNLATLKRLAHAFAAEGELAEMDHRSQDAAAAYLDTIRMGHETSRGGTIIDSLVGIAIESIGLAPLEKSLPNLDAKQCREIAASLETMESRRESVSEVLQNEKAWVRARYGWKTPFLQIISFTQSQAVRQKYAAKMTRIQTRAGRLAIDFAARAYELEHGEKPKRLDDLTPAYLKAIPKNTATGKPMAFNP